MATTQAILNHDRLQERFEDANTSSSTCVGGGGDDDAKYDPEQQYPSIEKGTSSPSKSSGAVHAQLDSKGLPLVPQPSRFKDDPLVS
jgi:hypothetical protein